MGVTETRVLFHDKSSECKCRSNKNVYNSMQKGNCDECWSDCKEINDSSFCKTCCILSPNTCDCGDKISEYLDIKNCFCEKRLFGKFVLAC